MIKKKKDPFEQFKGYYTFPFSGDPFEGDVIKLDKESLNALFQSYGDGDEGKFRRRLESMDEWLADKPYRVASNWVNLIVRWLRADAH